MTHSPDIYAGPAVRPNGNVTSHPDGRLGPVALDWPDIESLPNRVRIMRGHEGRVEQLLAIEGDPAEVADWLQDLAEVVTIAAGLYVCGDCGARFDPQADRPADLDSGLCGMCPE